MVSKLLEHYYILSCAALLPLVYKKKHQGTTGSCFKQRKVAIKMVNLLWLLMTMQFL